MSGFEEVYRRLPLWAQHTAVSAYGLYWFWLRFGPGYSRFVRQYTDRERFRQQDWAAWQTKRLASLLPAVATHVPYYSRTWSRSEKSRAAAGRLEELPLLEKDPVRAEPEAFLSENIHPWPRLIFHTSGSTGTPVVTYWTASELRQTMALREVRSARWANVSFRSPRATFSGRMVEPDPESPGPFYRFNAIERQAYLSPFHLRAEMAACYVEALRRHRIEWLTGYAVSYFILARFIVSQGLPVPPLRALITTSEKVTEEMRRVMETAYGCPVFEEYSNVENSLFASECERHRMHVSPEAGVVEILRGDGTRCEPGETGEVVSTTLIRQYQPLIRYRLGDMAAWEADPCPCGRATPLLREIVGRIEDVVVGPDGRQMVRFHGVFVDQPHILEGQVIQETLHRIRVRVVPVGGFGAADIEEIIRRVRRRLGGDVEVLVEPVESIPRTKAGKFQAVISLLRRPQEPPGFAERSLLSDPRRAAGREEDEPSLEVR